MLLLAAVKVVIVGSVVVGLAVAAVLAAGKTATWLWYPDDRIPLGDLFIYGQLTIAAVVVLGAIGAFVLYGTNF